ncbi:MAG: GTPase ObgE [Candidatus Omnitrophota bacterium]
MFVDTAKIYVKAGQGGKGCQSFYKDKYSRYPIANGGPGGRGGNIVIEADENIHTLLDFQYRRHFKSEKGVNGSSNNKKGKTGDDYLIKVPPGTIIRDFNGNLKLRDLKEAGERVIIAKGGEGGRGNASKKPATEGIAGEEKTLMLELKLIADCGIVGFPNAGKSTLISKISNAKPKIASYPFTTKEPVLGIVQYKPNHFFKVADIPGLIEGAHYGKGLGDKFLRHIERTRIIIHIIDMAGIDCRDPIDDYNLLNNELKQYDGCLNDKPQIIVANKMDIEKAEDNLKRFKRQIKENVFAVSAMKGQGLRELIDAIAEKLAGL